MNEQLKLAEEIEAHAFTLFALNEKQQSLVASALRLTGELMKAVKRWRHKARGSTYGEMGRGKIQISANTLSQLGLELSVARRLAEQLDMANVVIYRSDYDSKLWVRLTMEFEDGRFEELT